MTEKNNATCSICGNPYYLCISCKDYMKLSPWKIHTDTSEHYKIYQILHGLSTKVYDKSEAKNKLKNVDLSDLEDFRDNIKKTIKDILQYEDTVETNMICDSDEQDIEEPKVYRKRKSSKIVETD